MKDNYKEVFRRVFSRTPPSIKSKEECYFLYEAGFFGNKALTWNSYQEILQSGWNEEVCMRSKKGIDRKRVKYNLPMNEVAQEIAVWEREGIPESRIGFNEAMPDKRLLIQGEVIRTPNGLFFLYTTIKKPMNVALREKEERISGLNAKIILQRNLSPSSLSDMESLLQTFPNDVIEFSSYSIPVGNIQGRNTVIWEVRNY